MSTARAYVIRADEAPAYWQIRNLWHVMATSVQTGGSFCAIDQMVNVNGGGPPTHYHTQDEGMYIISGHCSYEAAGQPLLAGPGSFVAIPRYTEHSFEVDAPDTRFLNFYLPAGFDVLLMGLSVPAERDELPTPEDNVPLPPRKLVERLSADYGAIPVIELPFADHPTPANRVTKATPAAAVPPFMSNAANAPSYWHAGGLWSVLADAPSTNGSYSMFELLLPRGPAASPHVRETADEVFYVLEGEADFLLGDRVETAAKNSLVFIPKGVVRAFRVNSETARFLNIHTPAGVERLLAAEGERTAKQTLPPAGLVPRRLDGEHRGLLLAELGLREVAVADPFRS